MDPLRMINLAHLNHFVPADDAVLVNIVKSEAPINLLLQGSLAEGGEELHEVPEGDAPRVVPAKQSIKSLSMRLGHYLAPRQPCLKRV